MSDINTFLEKLFRKYLNGSLNDLERKQFFRLISDPANEKFILDLLSDAMENDKAGGNLLPADPDLLFGRIMAEAGRRKKERAGVALFRTINRTWWLVAAGLFLPLTLSVYFLWQNYRPSANKGANSEMVSIIDIPPGGNKAILTFDDGEQYILDTLSNGIVTRRDGAQVVKQGNGLLEYQLEDEKTESLVYHTITTPVGGQYQLILSDGTQVWINAASSVRFPAAFSKAFRKVYVTGEVYFEVKPQFAASSRKGKPDQLIPFIVEIAGKGKVEVLGTRFNVNSYAETKGIKTTLLEGSVQFTPLEINLRGQDGNENLPVNPFFLVPGQQAITDEQGKTEVISNVDLESVVAWKNGYFRFASSSLQEVMAQIARWYDIEVVLEKNMVNERFSGKIQLDLNLSEVLKILEKNELSFRMDGNTLYVRSL